MLLLFSPGHGQRLQVIDEANRVLVELELSHEPSWQVLWNHSVTGFVVTDYYRFDEGTMLLTATHTPDFAAGLGHIPGRGHQASDGKGGYLISDIDEPVPGNSYLLRVGSPRVDHRICHDGVCHSLSALAAGQRVTVTVIR